MLEKFGFNEVARNYNKNFYYNKLNQNDKNIYSKLYNAIINNEVEVILPYKGKIGHIHKILFYVGFDHPELININTSEMQYCYDGYDFEVHLSYFMDEDRLEMYENKLDYLLNNFNKLKRILNPKDRVERAIEDIMKYVKSYSTTDISHSIYGVLKNGQACCEGGSRFVKEVMTRLGIKCLICMGEFDDGEHAWNIIQYGHKFIIFDITQKMNYSDYKFDYEKDFIKEVTYNKKFYPDCY